MTRSATSQTDYYRLLGVASSASADEIRRAYRAAMKEIHPDRQSPEARLLAEERTKTLNIAYTTLSQPEKRRKYDDLLRATAVQDQIMSRYAGDMITTNPPPNAMRPPANRHLTERQRREQQAADRSAFSSLFYVFGGAALFVILAIAMFAVVGLILGRLF
ncbi:MAG: DnaJ domain-containing protein [Thermomicrobiales bacterium]|nr:DnaJ domain-containing protein [Thermomicrobiales bacterium]